MPKKVGGKTPKVEKMYQGMIKRGMPKGKAAAIAQAATSQSLVTGRKAKTHDGKPARKSKSSKKGK